MKLAKVEEHPGLVRDLTTGVILNVDENEREKTLKRIKLAMKETIEKEKIHNEINTMKSEIHDIKELLNKLLNKLGS